jgi:hypothetical protein
MFEGSDHNNPAARAGAMGVPVGAADVGWVPSRFVRGTKKAIKNFWRTKIGGFLYAYMASGASLR